MFGMILLATLMVLMISSLSTWPHTTSWGYLPSATVGTLMLLAIGLIATGKI
jgi:hypothetical protein